MEMSGPIPRTVIKRWQAGSWEARREDPQATLSVEDNKNSKELRRLIVQLERRQRELDRKRKEPDKREPH
jgi:hypothetical protein